MSYDASPAMSASVAAPSTGTPGVSRDDFNRNAIRLDLPVFWTSDTNANGAPDPDEIAPLLFFPTEGHWVDGQGRFTADFERALPAISAGPSVSPGLSPQEQQRRQLVLQELDAGRPRLLRTNLHASSDADRALATHLLAATRSLDAIYATMTGAKALEAGVPPDDLASRSLFRRNWGPRCRSAKMHGNAACSAIPGAPRLVSDAYPADAQARSDFCAALEKRADAKTLLAPFSVIRQLDGGLTAVPYTEAYAAPMRDIAEHLRAAAATQTGPDDAPLRAYLDAAATSFTTNDWGPADEAWLKMNTHNSRWYLRVAPDEVLNDPCQHKAQFHLDFARVNQGALAWQEKLTPLENDMEQAVAQLAGAPYAARALTFHLPDFIDMVFTAGDDRYPFLAMGGESLPNWGKAVDEGRSRTMVVANIGEDDPAVTKAKAAALFDASTLARMASAPEAFTDVIVLHEASHNFGPNYTYTVHGKSADLAFGGAMNAMLEELKAQAGAGYWIGWLQGRGALAPQLAMALRYEEVSIALTTVGLGVHSGDQLEPYAQLSAILLGILMDEGAVTFDASVTAANGVDRGAFTIHDDKLDAAFAKALQTVLRIKATNDAKAAVALEARYVDGPTVPSALIVDRLGGFPVDSFVYAVDL